jgi:hypothetical protein
LAIAIALILARRRVVQAPRRGANRKAPVAKLSRASWNISPDDAFDRGVACNQGEQPQ